MMLRQGYVSEINEKGLSGEMRDCHSLIVTQLHPANAEVFKPTLTCGIATHGKSVLTTLDYYRLRFYQHELPLESSSYNVIR